MQRKTTFKAATAPVCRTATPAGQAMLARRDVATAAAMLLGLVGLAIAVRGLSFFTSVVGIGHDESTYLIIGREIFHGKLLYTDVWDTKPPGIFYALGLLQQLAPSIPLLRLIASVLIGLTGFLLAQAQLCHSRSPKLAALSGALYVILISIEEEGLIINTPVFFNLFNALALIIVMRARRPGPLLLAGLCLGLSFLFKAVVAVEMLVFAAYRWFALQRHNSTAAPTVARRALELAAMAVGAMIPTALVLLYFNHLGGLDPLVHVLFEVPLQYSGGNPFKLGSFAWFLLKVTVYYGPVIVLCVASLKGAKDNAMGRLLFVWLLLDVLVATMPKRWFFHYTHQLLLPLCFAAPLVLGRADSRLRAWLQRHRFQVIAAVMLVLAARLWALKVVHIDQPDIPRQIAAYLRPRMHGGDRIFVGKHKHILHLLLDTPPLTPYVHPSILTRDQLARIAGFKPDAEISRIMAQKPRFVVVYKDYPLKPLWTTVKRDYVLKRTFPGMTDDYSLLLGRKRPDIQLYERRSWSDVLGTRQHLGADDGQTHTIAGLSRGHRRSIILF